MGYEAHRSRTERTLRGGCWKCENTEGVGAVKKIDEPEVKNYVFLRLQNLVPSRVTHDS